MSHPRNDVLVLLDERDPARYRPLLLAQTRLLHEISPRVLVVARPADMASLRAAPGVRAVVDEQVPPELLSELDESETLFVQAWQVQPELRGKVRPGEGASWDAPGFLQPDPPGTSP